MQQIIQLAERIKGLFRDNDPTQFDELGLMLAAHSIGNTVDGIFDLNKLAPIGDHLIEDVKIPLKGFGINPDRARTTPLRVGMHRSFYTKDGNADMMLPYYRISIDKEIKRGTKTEYENVASVTLSDFGKEVKEINPLGQYSIDTAESITKAGDKFIKFGRDRYGCYVNSTSSGRSKLRPGDPDYEVLVEELSDSLKSINTAIEKVKDGMDATLTRRAAALARAEDAAIMRIVKEEQEKLDP